jgi:peptidoglycan/LPS O-acetylase OafA/YrhL
MTKSKKIYFKNLDAIRFIAALMVFMQHGLFNSLQHLEIKNHFFNKIISMCFNGSTGVSIFFVLSGFLISYLLISEYEFKGKIDLKKFYIRRLLRIWPLYYAVVIFTFLLYPGLKILLNINQPLASNILYHLTFLSNFDVIDVLKNSSGMFAMSQNITWSVSIEEQFYLFWPLVFFLPKKAWTTTFFFLMMSSLLFRFYYYGDNETLHFHTISALTDLVVGGFFALSVKKHKKIKHFFEKSDSIHHGIILFLILVILYYEADVVLYNDYFSTIGRLSKSVLFGLFITSQSLTMNNSFLNWGKLKFASRWGKYTYGIYLLHPISILALDVTCRTFEYNYKINFISHFSIGILGFILTLIMSKLSYNYYEVRFLNLKKRFQIIKTKEH